MRRIIVLLCLLIGLVLLAARGQAADIEKLYINDVEGTLVVYEVGYMQCSIFFVAEGMAKTAPASCIAMPAHLWTRQGVKHEGVPFRILKRLQVEEE